VEKDLSIFIYIIHMILGRDILNVSLFIHLSYSLMEQICLTSSMDISHGLIIL